MFHTGRCGSTVLGQMLNQHAMVHWAGELFENHMQDPESRAMSATDVAKCINSKRSAEAASIFGFETKYLPQQHLSPRCINMDPASYIELLRDMGFDKYLLLHRNNYLRRFISAKVGVQTRTWHSQHEIASPTKVRLRTDSFGITGQPILKAFETLDKAVAELRCILENEDALEINYEEDILNDPRIAYVKVCQFLGIPDQNPDIHYVRTNPFKCADLIINYDEVERILVNTKYGWMLED